MPANNPAAYADVARRFNANPSGAGGFQNILDDLQAFLGMQLAEPDVPEDFVGPTNISDFAPRDRSRLARQALGGADIDMSGMQNAQGSMNDIMELLRRMRGTLPDASLAGRLR